MQKVTDWVVVVGCERKGNPDSMMPGLMPVRQNATGGRMQKMSVDVVL